MQSTSRQPRIISSGGTSPQPIAPAQEIEALQIAAATSRRRLLALMAPAVLLMIVTLKTDLSANLQVAIKLAILLLVLGAGRFAKAEAATKRKLWQLNEAAQQTSVRNATGPTQDSALLEENTQVSNPQTARWLWHFRTSRKIMIGLVIAISGATAYLISGVRIGNPDLHKYQTIATAYLIADIGYAVIVASVYMFASALIYYRSFIREFLTRRPGAKHADAVAAFNAVNHFRF
jgi:hypothetical protein